MFTPNFEYAPGDKVQDKLTGVVGIVESCTAVRINGNAYYERYCLQPKTIDEKGRPSDSFWIDEDRLQYAPPEQVAPAVSR